MLDRGMKVKDIVLEHSETARVFQENGIDFCCRGGVTVDDACAARGADPARLWRELAGAIEARRGAREEDPRTLTTAALIARIVDTHHAFLRQALPYARMLADKVARVHGDHNAKLPALKRAVDELDALLMPHLEAEETTLFPLYLASEGLRAAVGRETAQMLDDHLAVAATLQQVRDLADGFEPPSWACNSYRALLQELAAIEADTMRHVHIENHVLAPRFTTRTALASTGKEQHQ